MAKKKLIVKDFTGGIGTVGEKKDTANSCRWSKHLNPFEDPSYISLSRKLTKVSGDTVDSLVYWIEDGSPWSTDRYFYGANGKIFKETSGGVWSELLTVSGGTGEGLKVFDDHLYYATPTTIGRYGKLSGTPTESADFLSDGTTNLDQSSTGTGATPYTTPTSISEAAADRNTITPEKDPIKIITINVSTVGTGNWTLTLHDSRNVVIATKTIANGSMSTGDVNFTFSTPARVNPGDQYHFHITSTVADGGVNTGTNNDLEASYFKEYYGILIDNDWHMMEEFLNFLVILNDRYIAKWDQAIYDPNFIELAPGFQARCMAKFNEFLVVGAFKGATIAESEAARLYFWDGIETTFNYFTDCKVGAPNCLINNEGNLIGVYGDDGSMYLGSEPFQKIVDRIPKLAMGKKVEVYPGAISDFEGKTVVGISSSTDDGTGLEQGIFEYGHQRQDLPMSLNFPYTISTGTTQGTTLKIGCVKSIGNSLYVGWDDDSTYGVDKVTLGGIANATGTWESLIFDSGDPDKYIIPIDLVVTFEPLTSGQSVTPKYKLDRAASFTSGTAESTVGATSVKCPIYQRCKEIEVGFELTSSLNTFIKVTSVSLEYDTLTTEE